MPDQPTTTAARALYDEHEELRAAFSLVVRTPNDECSMYRLLTLVEGDTEGMCSGPVMYEARVLGAPDWSLRYHLCVACAAEFRREGKHEIRDRSPSHAN